VFESVSSTNTTSPMAGSTTYVSSSSCRSNLADATRVVSALCRRSRVPPEDCGGPWAFLELRQRNSVLNIADRLYELAKRRLAVGAEAFVHDYYEDVLQLQRWLEIDRFDRRGANRRLAALSVASTVRTA